MSNVANEPKQILENEAHAAGTIYSDPFSPNGSLWNIHVAAAETLASYAATITLQGSTHPSPDLTTDDDWVDLTPDHGWDGFPGGDPTSGNYKNMADVGNSAAKQYRLKISWTSGAATWNAWVVSKVGA